MDNSNYYQGSGKLFLPSKAIIESAILIPEDEWFNVFKLILLKVVNTHSGRDLLCISQNFPPIIEISKKHIKGKIGDDLYISEFHVGSKYANVIRSRWIDFKKIAKSFYESSYFGRKILKPLLTIDNQLVSANATDTFFPDPVFGGPTSDGFLRTLKATWDLVHDSTAGSSFNALSVISIESSFIFSQFQIARSYALFDTSSIPSGSTIDSASLDIFYTAKTNDDNDGDDFINIVQIHGNLAGADTNLSNDDYNEIGDVDNPTEGSTRTDMGSITLSQYTSYVFNATAEGWIAKSGIENPSGGTAGITYIGIREGHDIIDSPPTAESNMIATSADAGGTTQDPKLEVTYTPPVSNPQGTKNATVW